MQKVIISVLGTDRPGIIAAVTRVLFDLNFNIENVSQTILQSQFSGIFIAGAPENCGVEAMEQSLTKKLAPQNLDVFVKLLKDEDTYQNPDSEPFVITTKGPDRKGLVAGMTEAMARFDINVTSLQAVFKGGDDPDANIMIYEVTIPLHTDYKKLQGELQQIAAKLGLDFSIIHKNIFEAINRI